MTQIFYKSELHPCFGLHCFLSVLKLSGFASFVLGSTSVEETELSRPFWLEPEKEAAPASAPDTIIQPTDQR